jgi:serine/threonine protein kinase
MANQLCSDQVRPDQLCPNQHALSSYLCGILDEGSAESISDHLDRCDHCEQTIENLNAQQDTWVSKLRLPPPVDEFAGEVDLQGIEAFVVGLARRATSTGDAPVPDDLQGTTLGPYRLAAQLGVGGMGAVYRATHERLGKEVAIKVLTTTQTTDRKSIARFEREMRAVGGIEHPNIVGATDAGDADGRHYLVMELIHGFDFSRLAAGNDPFPVASACELIRQAACGLEAAHRLGMVHRDIKPSNLMLAKPRTPNDPPLVKVLDLGLALLSSESETTGHELTMAGQVMGTLDFMAPEQATGSQRVDHRADVYALGATLYRLLCGTAPLPRNGTMMQQLFAIANTTPASIESARTDIPKGLADLIGRMLRKDASERPQSASEVAIALLPFCDQHDLPALLAAQPQDSIAATLDPSLEQTITTGDEGTSPSAIDSASGNSRLTSPVCVAAETAIAKKALAAPGGSSRTPWVRWAVAAVPGGFLLAMLGVFAFSTPHGTLIVEVNDPDIAVGVVGESISITDNTNKQSIQLAAGEHQLTVTCGALTFQTPDFEMMRGENVVLTVRRTDQSIEVLKNHDDQPWTSHLVDQPVKPTDPKKDISPSLDANSRAVAWLLDIGATVRLENVPGKPLVQSVDELPTSGYQLEVSMQDNLGFHNAENQSLAGADRIVSLTCHYLGDQGVEANDLAAIATLPNLKTLRLTLAPQCQAEDVKPLGELKRLQTLSLIPLTPTNSDPYNDQLAAVVGRFSGLQSLNIGATSCPLTDAGVAELESLVGLTELQLMGGSFSDSAVSRLVSKLDNLKQLTVEGQSLQGDFIASIQAKDELQQLTLFLPSLSPTNMQAIGEMKSLEGLAFIYTKTIDTPTLGIIEQLPRLSRLTFHGTGITRPGLAMVAKCPDLVLLSLANNQHISDGDLGELSNLQKLINLSVSQCPNISDESVDDLLALGALQTLQVGNSGITPAGVERIKSLKPTLQVH